MKHSIGATALALTWAAVAGADATSTPTEAVTASSTFVHHMVTANGIKLHYAELGKGEPVLLLPGWPEDWYAWRRVAPMLAAQGRRVVILDPRGFGRSAKPARGYDLDTAAADVHAFLTTTGLTRPGGIDVVTHDLGGWIGYALASAHPVDVRSLVLSEVTIPNSTAHQPIPDDATNIKTWHFGFNRLPGLPEMLVAGHEQAFLDWLFDNKADHPAAIDRGARAEYVRAFRDGGAAAGFDYYRRLFAPAGLQRMDQRLSHPLTMPVLTIGASGGVGTKLADSLKRAVMQTSGTVLSGCGHYLPEECPGAFAGAVTQFWRQNRGTSG